MAITNAVLDELLKDCQTPDDLSGHHGILKRLTKALIERVMQAEMTHHLGYERHDPAGDHLGNSHNGTSGKTISGEFGKLAINVPRDRKSTFDLLIVRKGQRRWTGFDDKIIKILFLSVWRIAKRWTMPIHDWGAAINQFAILYGDRVPLR